MVSDGLLWKCKCTNAYVVPGGISFRCQWVIVGLSPPNAPDTGISDFAHVAISPRAFTKLHVGFVNRTSGQFTTFSDMTVLNRDNGGAEGRDPGHLALLHDLLVYNAGSGQWEYCRNTGWRYSSSYHYFMALNLDWGGPPCGAGRYYYNSGWSAQHEAGVTYYGAVGSGVTYAWYGGGQIQVAAGDQPEAGVPPAPAPPSKDQLDRHKPKAPDFEKDTKAGKPVYLGVTHQKA